jgi:hypothetical protein
MSEFEQDPSASTGRFRAFVEGGEEDRAGRSPVSPAMLVIAGVVIVAVIIVIVAMA